MGAAKELVELQPDAIFAANTPAVVALMRETCTIPIIFAGLSDPVDTGLVPSLARPGGNITGFIAFESAHRRPRRPRLSRSSTRRSTPLADHKIKARLADLGSTPLVGSATDFGKLLAEETEKWAEVFREANIRPQ